ncbi:ATPase family AAA domain-containing protein 1-A, partial [Aphis craccivora]
IYLCLGVLLHGPSGCGKSIIAKATARESKINFINLNDILSFTNKPCYFEIKKLVRAFFSFYKYMYLPIHI